MGDVSRFVIDRGRFKTEDEFRKAIGKAVEMFCYNECVCVCRYSDAGAGIFVIEYNYDNEEYGTKMPYWMTPDEYWEGKS